MRADMHWWLLRLVIEVSNIFPCNATSRLRQAVLSSQIRRLHW